MIAPDTTNPLRTRVLTAIVRNGGVITQAQLIRVVAGSTRPAVRSAELAPVVASLAGENVISIEVEKPRRGGRPLTIYRLAVDPLTVLPELPASSPPRAPRGPGRMRSLLDAARNLLANRREDSAWAWLDSAVREFA